MRIAAARANFTGYKYYVSPRYASVWDAKHLNVLDQKLMAVERGEIKRLIICMPPRHYKSQTATAHFTAWYLGKHPDHNVITASYSSTLVRKFSRQTRALVARYGPEIFGMELADDSKKIEDWAIQLTDGEMTTGGYRCAGIGGSFSGTGAHLFIIDDPHKDRKEANSATMRENVWEWYTSAAYTRMEADGAMIVIQTRWSEEDLAGRLISSMDSGDEYAEEWDVVSFPALAESDEDPLGRKEGEPLWPERFDLKRYYSIRASVGIYEWFPQFQQRPQAISGGAFKAHWFKWYTKNEISFHNEQWWFRDEPLKLYQGVDPAISEKTEADDFVVFTLGITPTHKIVLLDVFHDHLDFESQPKKIVEKYQEFAPERVGIETNAYQDALRQTVIKKAMMSVKQLNHTGDKFTRIMTTTPYFENGQVYLRQATDDETDAYVDVLRLPGVRIHRMWKKFWQQAVTYAPKAAHDDILDAMENCFELCKPIIIPNANWQ